MRPIRNIVILTGAGISAESGLATFRGPDGLWEGHRVEDVATPEAFARDPALVHAFYDARRANLASVEPNDAHRALARLDAARARLGDAAGEPEAAVAALTEINELAQAAGEELERQRRAVRDARVDE